MGPTQSAVQWMQGTVFPGVKQPEDEDDTFPSLCQVMNGALFPSHLGFLVCCLSKAAVLYLCLIRQGQPR